MLSREGARARSRATFSEVISCYGDMKRLCCGVGHIGVTTGLSAWITLVLARWNLMFEGTETGQKNTAGYTR